MSYRSLIPSLVLLLPLAGQETLRPKAVLEVGLRYLSPRSEVFVTNAGKVLAFSKARGEAPLDRLAIWDGATGSLERSNLEPLDEATTFAGACGGGGWIPTRITLHSNLTPSSWNPSTQRFRLPVQGGEPPLELDESGHVAPVDPSRPHAAEVDALGPNSIRITPRQGSPWMASLAMPPGAEQIGLKPIQRLLVGPLGFQHVLADREGRWLLATWEGSTPSQAPNRRLVPFKRDGNPRWLLFEPGASLPVMEEPLGSILGNPAKLLKLSLSAAGDRVLVETDSRVVVFDPATRSILVNRQGSLVIELPGRNHILLREKWGGPYTRVDLASGTKVGFFEIPESLDPPLPEAPILEAATPQPNERRQLTSPVAFSPDGHYMVTPRYSRQGFHWDGLVVWDLDEPGAQVIEPSTPDGTHQVNAREP